MSWCFARSSCSKGGGGMVHSLRFRIVVVILRGVFFGCQYSSLNGLCYCPVASKKNASASTFDDLKGL
jgi:hypothetical protein